MGLRHTRATPGDELRHRAHAPLRTHRVPSTGSKQFLDRRKQTASLSRWTLLSSSHRSDDSHTHVASAHVRIVRTHLWLLCGNDHGACSSSAC